MLPPVLEIIVVWHPKDPQGAKLATAVFEHFHGTAYSGLIGGAIEVYVRSAGWEGAESAPRPLPIAPFVHPAGVDNPHVVAILPLLGIEMACEVETAGSAWDKYMQSIMAAARSAPNRVGVFPYLMSPAAVDGTRLGQLLNVQQIGASGVEPGDSLEALLCRELAQGVAQLLRNNRRLTIFISHTKRYSEGEGHAVERLIDEVREVIQGTRLGEFFDAKDLQPGQDWDAHLRTSAGSSALLAIRTDLYPTREWCQREMLIAKREGMPVVILDAPGAGEERGSFLMDHVPRTPIRRIENDWDRAAIYRALDVMVDQCLKRELWLLQQELTPHHLGVDVAWWAPHAPEPVTFLKWLVEHRPAPTGDDLIVMHPDPPLGADEKRVLQEILELTGSTRALTVMTPRLLAARSV